MGRYLRLTVWSSLALWAGTALAQAVTQPRQLVPADAFYRRPDIEQAALSPSGRWLAMTSSVGSGVRRRDNSDDTTRDTFGFGSTGK